MYLHKLFPINGLQFTSDEFQSLCERFHVKHITSSPCHPRMNGEAEHFVCTIKGITGKKEIMHDRLRWQIYQFLLSYHNTPHATTGFLPAQN